MNRNEGLAVAVIFTLLLVGFMLFRWTSHRRPLPPHDLPEIASSTAPVPAPIPAKAPAPPKAVTLPVAVSSAPAKAIKPVAHTSEVPKAPPVKLHQELIPKDISIVRFSYGGQDIASPGS